MKIKNEKKALKMFCSEDTIFRKQLTRPFIDDLYDGKVIATDGYVLLIVDRKMLRCKYETDSLKIPPQQSYKPISIPISFAAIDDAYNQLELVPEEVSEDGKDKDCPECLGEGKVEFEYNAENGETYYHLCNCPICDGTGIREDYVPVKTGRMLVPKGSVFIMHRTYFDVRRVWKVVEALRLMGFEQMTWVGESETGMNRFEVCDGIDLVLMPMANTNNFKQEVEIKLEDRLMSNLCKRMAKVKKPCARKRRQEMHRRCSKKYTSFNIFTKYGENTIIKTDRPMTEYEVHYIYGALSVSGIE